jgi:hypothetical protein
VIEKKIVEADKNTESEKEEVLKCRDCGIIAESKNNFEGTYPSTSPS